MWIKASAQLYIPATLPLGNVQLYPLDRKLEGSRGKEKNPLLLPCREPRIDHPVNIEGTDRTTVLAPVITSNTVIVTLTH
jgi:hypothetical protein